MYIEEPLSLFLFLTESIFFCSSSSCCFKSFIWAVSFSFSVCSCSFSPFHDSAASVRAGSERKRRNLGQAEDGALNFGGQQQELWCEGGEVAFILRMIAESKGFGRQVKWFTTLVSRGDNLPPLYRALTDVGAVKVVKKEMAQGQKQSRFIAWSFMDDNKRRK